VGLGFPPGVSFRLDLLNCPEQHRYLLAPSIGLLLAESPNPDRRSFRPLLPFNPTELIRVSPQ
jgi:hypothetical protein